MKVQVWREFVLCECVSVAAHSHTHTALQASLPVVTDWIHSSRLMLCHPALSAIKLAPVLKSLAANVAEAETFPPHAPPLTLTLQSGLLGCTGALIYCFIYGLFPSASMWFPAKQLFFMAF